MPVANSAVSTLPHPLAAMMRPLPLLPLQPLLAVLLRRITLHHPGIFERLGAYAGKRFGIDPIDLPFAFVLEPVPHRPMAVAVRRLPPRLDVRISGPLAGLFGLVGGDLDGDALFFSRDLTVEGDMEAAVALRSAIDDAEMDLLGEILAGLGPFKAPAARILRDLMHPVRTSRGTRAEAEPWN